MMISLTPGDLVAIAFDDGHLIELSPDKVDQLLRLEAREAMRRMQKVSRGQYTPPKAESHEEGMAWEEALRSTNLS